MLRRGLVLFGRRSPLGHLDQGMALKGKKAGLRHGKRAKHAEWATGLDSFGKRHGIAGHLESSGRRPPSQTSRAARCSAKVTRPVTRGCRRTGTRANLAISRRKDSEWRWS